MTSAGTNRPAVRQMRLVVEAEDYDASVHFYRDVLGLRELAAFTGDEEARVMILDAGRATLEIANPAQTRMIDQVEVGRRVAPKMRVALSSRQEVWKRRLHVPVDNPTGG